MLLMPFLTYMGPLRFAHDLVLVRFGGELLGRLFSHFHRLNPKDYYSNKALLLLSFLFLMRATILVTLLCGAFQFVTLSHDTILSFTTLFYFIFAWTNSEVMAAVTLVAPEKRMGELMRGMMLLTFGSQLLSLALGQWLVEQFLRGVAPMSLLFARGVAPMSLLSVPF